MDKKLFDHVTQATGLPEDLISNELNGLVAKAGKSPDDLTLEDLRLIMAEYLQDVFLSAKEFFEQEDDPAR